MVVQSIRNRQVVGSIPTAGSISLFFSLKTPIRYSHYSESPKPKICDVDAWQSNIEFFLPLYFFINNYEVLYLSLVNNFLYILLIIILLKLVKISF